MIDFVYFVFAVVLFGHWNIPTGNCQRDEKVGLWNPLYISVRQIGSFFFCIIYIYL